MTTDTTKQTAAAQKWLAPAERQGFESFLSRMPSEYLSRMDPEDMARHWQLLQRLDLHRESPKRVTVTYHGDIENFWLGRFEPLELAAEIQRLDPRGTSPLVRVFVDSPPKMAICVTYPNLPRQDKARENALQQAHTLTGEELLGPAGEVIRTVRLETSVAENRTRLKVLSINCARTTFFRNVFEILVRHDLQLTWFELWSGQRLGLSGDGRFRSVKTLHTAELEIDGTIDAALTTSLEGDLRRYLQSQLKPHSLFDIVGPTMVGPSSSHTAGANRIGQVARNMLLGLKEGGVFKQIESISVKLFGSFRDTGPGHGTHIALAAGLAGIRCDDPGLAEAGSPERLVGGIPWEEACIPFEGFVRADPEEDAIYIQKQGDCANIAAVMARVDGGKTFEITGFSTGGGLVEIRFLNGARLQPSITGKRDLYFPEKLTFETVIDLHNTPPNHGRGRIAAIYSGRPPADHLDLAFNTFEEVQDLCERTSKNLVSLALETENKLQSSTSDEVYATMAQQWLVMQRSVQQGLSLSQRSPMGLSGGDAHCLLSYLEKENGSLGLADLAPAYALAASEVNAVMGRIVACPTGGACGILPGVLMAHHHLYPERGEKDILNALLVAAFVGMVIYDDVPTAGAALGCQAEIGVATAMAAAALVELHGGDVEAVIHGAVLALKNCMGLVCDPVAGLVEIPCVKRNGLFASVAVTASQMAVAGIRSQISPDEVVLAVKEVGERLHTDYKETSRGGLARTGAGKALNRRFLKTCRDVFVNSVP